MITCGSGHTFTPDPNDPPGGPHVCPECKQRVFTKAVGGETTPTAALSLRADLHWDGTTLTLAAVLYAALIGISTVVLPAGWLSHGIFAGVALLLLLAGLFPFKSQAIHSMRWILSRRGWGIRRRA